MFLCCGCPNVVSGIHSKQHNVQCAFRVNLFLHSPFSLLKLHALESTELTQHDILCHVVPNIHVGLVYDISTFKLEVILYHTVDIVKFGAHPSGNSPLDNACTFCANRPLDSSEPKVFFPTNVATAAAIHDSIITFFLIVIRMST